MDHSIKPLTFADPANNKAYENAVFFLNHTETMFNTPQYREMIQGLVSIIGNGTTVIERELQAEPTNFADVASFHTKFMVPFAQVPAFLDMHTTKFRVDFMQEELTEFSESVDERNLEKAADALIDLAYVTLGTAHMMGLPWQVLWDSVHKANMAKRLAKPDGSDSKRGSPLDVIKPEGWTAPVHWESLGLKPDQDPGTFNAHAMVLMLTQDRLESTGS